MQKKNCKVKLNKKDKTISRLQSFIQRRYTGIIPCATKQHLAKYQGILRDNGYNTDEFGLL